MTGGRIYHGKPPEACAPAISGGYKEKSMCKLERRIIEDLMVERIEKNRLIAVSGMSIEELTDAFTKGYRLVSPEEPQERSDKE